jgi:formylglycine-generating enzyme required for sulfatase activity
MTELEFEKACRGTIAPVRNEFPWGNFDIAGGDYTLANDGATNEGIATDYSTTGGNSNYLGTCELIDGPLRGGIFAANSSNTGRVSAGASYYGIMELGGNIYERVVTIANVEGRAFTGLHGNGSLAAGGDHDTTAWPAPATGIGVGARGGGYFISLGLVRVSDRMNAVLLGPGGGDSSGGRGVRLAP